MAEAWNTGTEASSFVIGNQLKDVIDQYGSQDRGISGLVGEDTNFGGVTDSVVGINAAQIPQIQDKLIAYINKVNSVYEKLNTDITTHSAIYNDELGAEVRAYLVKYKEYLQNLTTYLKLFNDKLTAVHNDYLSHEQRMKSDIKTSENAYTLNEYTSQVSNQGQ